MLVAIIKKRPDIKADYYEILQIFGLTFFKKTSQIQFLVDIDHTTEEDTLSNHLDLFGKYRNSSAILLEFTDHP